MLSRPNWLPRGKSASGSTQNKLIVILLLLSLFKGLFLAAIIPPWQAPDEPKHFEYVARLYNSLRFPGTYMAQLDQQPRIIASMRQYDFWRFGYSNSPPERSYNFASIWIESPTELHRPPLYYATELLAYSFVSRRDTATQLYALRAASVMMGVLVVLIAFLAARAIFPDDLLLATAVPAFVAFLPMPSFIFASVNSDNLANLIAALFVLGLTGGFAKAFSHKRVVGLLGLMVVGLLTKRTMAFTIPLGVVALLVWWFGQHREAVSRMKFGAVTVGVALAAGASLPFWNWRGAGRALLDRYVFDSQASLTMAQFVSKQYTPGQIGQEVLRLLGILHQSFWGQFGWMNVIFDDPWYYPLMGATAIAALGILIMAVRHFRGTAVFRGWQVRILAIYLASIIIILCFTLGQAVLEVLPGTQGRYLFPVIIPIATMFVLGIRELLPVSFRAAGVWMVLGGLFLFDVASQVYLILPYYYG